MRTFFIVGFLLGWVSVAISQGTYSIRNYKAIDGLPQSQVNIMLEDKNGYLWIGTHGGGLARFDGREFVVYTTLNGLQSNIISYLKLDERENLWIVHPRGITKFDGIRFMKFSQPGSPTSTRRLRKIFELKDTLFFSSTQGELGKIYGDSVYYWARPIRPRTFVRYAHVAPNREVMLYLSDSTFLVRTPDQTFPMSHKVKFNRLLAMFNYKDMVWLRTDSGVFKMDLEKRQFLPATFPIKNHVAYYDTINDLFWTQHGNHLLKEKVRGDVVEIDTAIRDINVTQVLVDSEGNTWFATDDGGGLYKYFIQDFDRCGSDNLRTIWAIHKDSRGTTWIGSDNRGVWKIKKGKITSYASKNESYRNRVFCVAESPDSVIWIGTDYGLGKYSEKSDSFEWYTRDQGLSNASIRSLDFEDSGGMWIGTFSGGVNYFDGKTFRAFTMRDGLASNSITALHYSTWYDRIFVGTEFGVSTIHDGHVQSIVLPGIENTSVSSINPFRDSLLLIGSHGAGMMVYNPKNNDRKILTTHHGLASDFIYFVAADQDNYIWVGTEKGITRIKLSDNLEIDENLHYDYDNGLTGVETNTNAFYLGETKYFGLLDGLYQFNEIERKGRKSFGSHLTDIQLSYGDFSIRDYADSLVGFFKIPFYPQLPPDRNHITFHFNRVDKRYPKSVKFKYFLQNFDKTWSQPSSDNEVTYSNLPPGAYVFKIMATNNQGSWDPEQTYAFVVRKPFYQTASFIAGMFVLLAGSVTLILYMRVKQRVNQVMMLERIRAQEQETLRKEIARDFHDEMGNQLTRIINYVSLLKLNGNGNGNHTGHDLYSKVEDSAKYLYSGTRDFIWAIDPGNDELSKLFIHIRDFGEKLFEEKNISFRAFNEVKEKRKLPYGFSREANLIFKEAMTNAFKYSDGKNVTLSLYKTGDTFEITLEDDGVGFYTGEVQKSNGLKNIRERADRINAVLRIQSVKNQGTKIVLNFKLNKTLKYGLAV